MGGLPEKACSSKRKKKKKGGGDGDTKGFEPPLVLAAEAQAWPLW